MVWQYPPSKENQTPVPINTQYKRETESNNCLKSIHIGMPTDVTQRTNSLVLPVTA